MKKPELLIPINSIAGIKTAEKAGADAVYFGVNFNSNMRTSNISLDDLKKLKKFKVKKYLTINSIYYDIQLENLEKLILITKDFVDAYICWDVAAIQLLRKYNLPFFVSTQASVTNAETAKFYKDLGAKKIVLARELTLEQIKKIKEEADIPVEVFIHGSMCMAISGRCFISQDLFKKSANRGQCLNNCRREYIIKDKQEGQEMILGEDYILNAKDLCALPFIDKLIEAGIDSFKVEGRNKKVFIGKVINYLDKNKVAIIEVQANPLKVKDTILVIGPTTGTVEENIDSMEIEHNKVKEVKKGLVDNNQ